MNAAAVPRSSGWFALTLLILTALLVGAGLCVGSSGWELPWAQADGSAPLGAVVWDIRLPRTLGAALAGALLGLGGAVAQGLFRNPLADPYLLGSASGAALGVASLLVWLGLAPGAAGLALRMGLTGAAFAGAVLAVALTLALARGVQQTLRLLLAGVVVGMVLGALTSLLMLRTPEIMRSMQAFMLGSTALLGWSSVTVLALACVPCMAVSIWVSRALDALTLGESTAQSLGVPMAQVRLIYIAVLALSTGAAVAQVGLVAFIGLMAPHLVRAATRPAHAGLLLLSSLMGAVLLLASDVLARGLLAPQELPVGVLTAVLGGGYLLWLMYRRPA